MKTVLITGISRGLGLALTSHYLEKGCRILGISRSDSPDLKALIEKYPDRLKWCQIDLSKIHSLEVTLKEKLDLENEKIDFFIDNAAILYKELIHRIQTEQMTEMFVINAVAPIIVTKIVINNFLRNRTPGIIVHLSSICAHRSFNGLSMIGATKAAIETFSQDTAFEYGRFGIRSNTVVLGLLEIGMRSTVNDKLSAELKSRSALGRLTDTESAINAIDFLTSEKSSSVTGTLLHVNAGYL